MQVLFNDLSAILNDWSNFSKTLKSLGNRQLLLLENQPELVTILQNFVEKNASEKYCLLPNTHSSADRKHQIRALLGKELNAIVFDATNGLDATLLIACSGTLVAGGTLILVVPNLEDWPTQSDTVYHSQLGKHDGSSDVAQTSSSRFIRRTIRVLLDHCEPLDTNATVFSTHRKWHHQDPTLSEYGSDVPNADELAQRWQLEQQQHLALLHRSIVKQNQSASVVMADRGRGKSALLGMLAAKLVQQGFSVATTASVRANANVLYRHSDTHLKGNTELPFVPVDQLARWSGEVLLVEEAGSLPLSVLQQLALTQQHIVYATTVHGYEGAGRSFAIRFTRWLDAHRPGWNLISPQWPVRWGREDPLETLIAKLGLLDPESALPECQSTPSDWVIRQLDSEELLSNEKLLAGVYHLLSTAHYQTTPDDLRHLLDQPSMRVFAMVIDSDPIPWVIGVALVTLEGELSNELFEPIIRKQRRLHNQLIPQLFAQCLNTEKVLAHRFARITRIAIAPERQRTGLGSHLLTYLIHHFTPLGYTLGASFGANIEVLPFWLKHQFYPIHFGHRTNSRSGLRSVCVLREDGSTIAPLIKQAQELLQLNHAALIRMAHISTEAPKPSADAALSEFEHCCRLAFDSMSTSACSSKLTEVNSLALIERFHQGERNFADTAWAIESHQRQTSEIIEKSLQILSQKALDGNAHHGRQDVATLLSTVRQALRSELLG